MLTVYPAESWSPRVRAHTSSDATKVRTLKVHGGFVTNLRHPHNTIIFYLRIGLWTCIMHVMPSGPRAPLLWRKSKLYYITYIIYNFIHIYNRPPAYTNCFKIRRWRGRDVSRYGFVHVLNVLTPRPPPTRQLTTTDYNSHLCIWLHGCSDGVTDLQSPKCCSCIYKLWNFATVQFFWKPVDWGFTKYTQIYFKTLIGEFDAHDVRPTVYSLETATPTRALFSHPLDRWIIIIIIYLSQGTHTRTHTGRERGRI